MLRQFWFSRAGPAPAVAPSGGAVAECTAQVVGRGSEGVLPDASNTTNATADYVGAVRHVHALIAGLAARLGAVESRFSLAASSLSGLSALQAAVAHDDHRLGRCLAACARAVLIEKLHVCPPKRRGASASEGYTQSAVRVELVCTLAAMEQLLDINKMVLSPVRHRQPGRQSLKAYFKSFHALAEALSMTPTMMAEVQVRSFRKGDETRLLMEHHKTDTGQVMYVLERRCATGEVRVATRETEAYDGRQRRFLSALEVKVLKSDDLPGLPTQYPSTVTWTESRHGVASTVGGHDTAAEKLVLSVPVSVVQGKAADLAAFVKEDGA